MAEPAINSAMLSAMAAAAALSLAAGFFLFQRHVNGQPLLPYEPRRRVPWGPVVVMIPLLILAMNAGPFLAGHDVTAKSEVDAKEYLYGGLVTSLVMIAFVVVAMAWLLAERKADRQDLGLPLDKRQFWSDVRAGCVGCLAAMVPIYVINLTLVIAFQSQEQHPLIEHLLKDHSLPMMLIGLLSAVVAAPLFEEFTFRVLLQGWLERIEDERTDYAATLRTPVELVGDFPEADGQSVFLAPETVAADEPRPAQGWCPTLPHGWTPIIISALAFGLAHISHGVAPVPLVFLGLVLGYLYQRTHRIAPSIAAHALFNAYSFLLLWLQLREG